MADDRLTLTRRIDASANAVFAVITDPRQHVDIDGSGMLMAAPDAQPLRAVGDTFDIDMDREPLGDLPMGKYKVRNTVTKFVSDVTLEWNVGGVDQPPFGHVYGYELVAAEPDVTEVTLYYDWTGVRASRIRDRFPIIPVYMLEKSLDNLQRIVAGDGERLTK
jgi:hypothetical protein